MGTRNSRLRRRATKRGLASFVSFLLLFAFALGQSSLSALADDAGTDPVAAEDLVSDGSTGEDTLPVADAPEEEAPAEETPAEEPPADVPDAPDPAPSDDATGDSDGGSGGGAAAAAPATRHAGKQEPASANRDAIIQSHGGLHGGDVSLDYVAAGPFTYNHATGLGVYPTFGYNDRTIDPNDGVVESLESGDFACGDHVTFFTQIAIEEGADGPGTVQLHQTWGMEPTGQPGLGFNNIVSVAINTPDDGNVGNVADNVVTLDQEFTETVGYDQLHGLISVTNLAPGETAILRIVVILACGAGSPTGNILNDIESARVVLGGGEFDTISVGQQTVPMKVTGFVGAPAINITKTCPASVPFGQPVVFQFTLVNDGNEPLTNVVVNDPLLGGNITAAFGLPNPVPVGTTVYTASIPYTPGANEDPVQNAVTVTAAGSISAIAVADGAACDTDITHVPNIDVTKSCPAEVPFGEAITYTITLQNTGNEPLELVSVNDSLLGVISATAFNPDLPDPLPVGNTIYTATVSYTPVAGDPDPITNTVTAEGTGVDSGVEDTDTANCTTDITHEPGIDVTKSCPAEVPFGEAITYTITLQNTGNEPLELVSVNDSLLGVISATAFNPDLPDPLPVGNTIYTATVSYTPVAGDPDPITNTVTAEGTGVDSGVEDTDTANCTTDITHEPGIDVTKSCPAEVPFGEAITYTITLQNTGNEPLELVSVNDSLLGVISATAFNPDLPDPLPVGNTIYTATVSYTPVAGDPDPITNTVTAEGTGVDSGVEDTDTANCTTDITHEPGIDVTKSCPASAGVGDVITYEITITNTGNEALVNITVNDSILGDVSDEFPDTLGVGDSFTAFIDYTVTEQSPDPIHNVVTASGLGADSEVEATDEASCDTDVEHPAIQIVKDGPALVHRGDTITYLFEVTNIGDVDLFDVELTDPICDEGTIALVDDGDGDSMLAIGEVWHFTCTHLVTDDDPDPIPNTGTVTGDTDEGEGGDEVTDTDDHVVDIIHPGIEIVKTVDEETVPIGTTVTYTYVITNTGDTTLYDISVDDDILGHIGDIEVLEPGQSVTLTKDFVVGDEPVTNVGTAEGEDILGRSVSSLDDATVTPIADVPPEEPPTPFTGSDAGRLGIISMVLFGIGVTVVATTRRRRPEREAA